MRRKKLTVKSVQKEFKMWRQKRRGRDPIPEPLWTLAVRLTKKMSVNQVSHALGLNHTALSNRVSWNDRRRKSSPKSTRHPAAVRDTVRSRQPKKQSCGFVELDWNWYQPNGAPRDMVCRGLMLALHRAGEIELPPVKRIFPNPLVRRRRPPLIQMKPRSVAGTLSELGKIEFRQVRRCPEERLFNSLIETYHYLRYTQPVGEHLKFLIYADGHPIACLAWSSAPRHLGARDRYIGWSPEARRRNIRFIAYNTRYLILPWVTVRHLASHLLGRMTRVLSEEWERLYGHGVYFAETFVEPSRFRGTCYYAANWVYMGKTTGRGKDDQTNAPNRPIKDVLGYPLAKDFRRLLSAMPSSRQEAK